jgi:hypothetical protein
MAQPPIAVPPTLRPRMAVPPPIAGPPIIRPRMAQPPPGALADTKTDFSYLSAGPADDDSSSQMVETVESSPSIDDDDSPSVEMQIPVADDWMTVFRPLAIFVLAPLALVGSVVLLWWLARAIW